MKGFRTRSRGATCTFKRHWTRPHTLAVEDARRLVDEEPNFLRSLQDWLYRSQGSDGTDASEGDPSAQFSAC